MNNSHSSPSDCCDQNHGEIKQAEQLPEINFDVVLREIGSFGRYQIFLVTLTYYLAIPVMLNQFGSIFLAAIPEYRCRIPTIDDNIAFYSNITKEQVLRLTTPRDPNNNKYDGCRRYIDSAENCSQLLVASCFTNETIPCDEGYIYDTSMYESTIVTEWNLVCDRLSLGAVSTTIYFCGVFFSAIIGGNLSDRFGRTRVMFGCQLALVVLGIACSYSPTFASFVVLRFCIALFAIGSLAAAFVYVIEIVGDEWRTVVGITIQGVSAVALTILSALSNRWRNWREIQFAIAMSSVIFIALWWFLPESPRWLFSKGLNRQAKQNSEKFARRNGTELTDDVWKKAETDGGVSDTKYFPHELVRRPHMRLITFNVTFIWFVTATVYYGLSLNVGALAGDDRINSIFSGLVEIFACPLVILTMDRFGRRLVLATTLFVGGSACLISTMANGLSVYFPGLSPATTVFGLTGKFAISGAFALLYNYTGELFPTVVRGTAIGTGSMAARIGSILSPLIIYIQYHVSWLPSALFGVLSLVAGFSSLRLPETNKVPLTTTLEEAENFYAAASKHRDSEGAELLG